MSNPPSEWCSALYCRWLLSGPLLKGTNSCALMSNILFSWAGIREFIYHEFIHEPYFWCSRMERTVGFTILWTWFGPFTNHNGKFMLTWKLKGVQLFCCGVFSQQGAIFLQYQGQPIGVDCSKKLFYRKDENPNTKRENIYIYHA